MAGEDRDEYKQGNRQRVPLRTALHCGHMHESFNGRNNMGLTLLGQLTTLKLISLVLGLQFPATANWLSSLSDVYILCGSIHEACLQGLVGCG